MKTEFQKENIVLERNAQGNHWKWLHRAFHFIFESFRYEINSKNSKRNVQRYQTFHFKILSSFRISSHAHAQITASKARMKSFFLIKCSQSEM